MWIPIIFISYILQHVLLLADSGPGGGEGGQPPNRNYELSKYHIILLNFLIFHVVIWNMLKTENEVFQNIYFAPEIATPSIQLPVAAASPPLVASTKALIIALSLECLHFQEK